MHKCKAGLMSLVGLTHFELYSMELMAVLIFIKYILLTL